MVTLCGIIIDSLQKSEELISNFSFSTVSADGLALLGAKTSTGTGMKKFWSRMCRRPEL